MLSIIVVAAIASGILLTTQATSTAATTTNLQSNLNTQLAVLTTTTSDNTNSNNNVTGDASNIVPGWGEEPRSDRKNTAEASAWKLRFHENRSPPHINYRIDMLDHHRAFLHTGHAGCARPELFVRYMRMNERLFIDIRWNITIGNPRRGLLHEALTNVHDDFFWRERFPRSICRTDRRTPSTFCTCITIEELLPGQVLNIKRTKPLSFSSSRLIGFNAERDRR